MCPASTILLSGLANPSSDPAQELHLGTLGFNPRFVTYCLCELGHGTVTLPSLNLLMCKMG